MQDNLDLVLNIKNLSKSYDNKLIFDKINLQIFAGEIFGLIGINGAGKTSLIKIILDMINCDEGQIFIENISNKNEISRKNLVYLPEKFLPSILLTGEEFLKFSVQLYGQNYDKDLVEFIMSKIDFPTNLLKKPIINYSKGISQKLGIISNFICEKKIMILDEPMSGLDAKARIDLKDLIKFYNREKKTTIFFTTHILTDIEELCSNMGLLHESKIIYNGEPKKMLDNAANLNFEESFLKKITVTVK